mmetsp:Transcript_15308/g.31748  ORF Transcript_15308/g.31748 Transcript_15308/m.31748 type:complete len:264 (+) Transcript_15308:183-974(+)
MKTTTTALLLFFAATSSNDALAFRPQGASHRSSLQLQVSSDENAGLSRRDVFATVASTAITASSVAGILTSGGLDSISQPEPANAIGPVKINLMNPKYSAVPCPKDRPIPGEKAMKGMRGLCVTVDVDLEEVPDRELEKIGVYGYITDKGTGESVLANNPDLSTDAGQFAIIEKITKTDKKTQFEFIAAVPQEIDLRPFEEGIAPLTFRSLRVVSFPGGQQYGSINPCEMNEFSDECAVWEDENGAYEKKEYMVKSNERTKGR